MKINFYYLKGISEIDTPSFIGKTDNQIRLFFDTYKVLSLDTNTFYPPYFTNTIKLDTDDIAFNTSVNYLSIEYNSKYYYYFIKSINYISENVYSIDIELDTLVTFWNNIEFNDCIIERKFINRWTSVEDKFINRNYVRENFSNADEHITYNKIYTHNDDFYSYSSTHEESNWEWDCNGIFIAMLSDYEGHGQGSSRIMHHNKALISPYALLYMPYSFNYNTIQIKQYSSSQTPPTNIPSGDFLKGLIGMASNAKIFDFYFIPFNPLYDSIKTKGNNSTGCLDCYVEYELFSLYGYHDWTGDNGTNAVMQEYLQLNQHYPSTKYIFNNTLWDNVIDKLPLTFNPVTSITSSPQNEPSIIDENYFEISFGEKEVYSTAPLFLFKSLEIYCNFDADYQSGARIYYFDGASTVDTNAEDEVYNKVSATSNISVDILTNAFNQWRVQNRATGFFATVKTGISLIPGLTKAGMKSADVGAISASVMSSPSAYTKRGYLSSEARKTLVGLSDKNSKVKVPAPSLSALDYVGTAVNKKLEGSYGKVKGSLPNVIMADYCFPHLLVKTVDDINKCNFAYRSSGNRVDEFYSGNNLFNYIRTRYYYNYVKLSYCDIHLVNYITDEDIINSIKNRLIDGIRLWEFDNNNVIKMPNGMQDYSTYDNVELDFIGG